MNEHVHPQKKKYPFFLECDNLLKFSSGSVQIFYDVLGQRKSYYQLSLSHKLIGGTAIKTASYLVHPWKSEICTKLLLWMLYEVLLPNHNLHSTHEIVEYLSIQVSIKLFIFWSFQFNVILSRTNLNFTSWPKNNSTRGGGEWRRCRNFQPGQPVLLNSGFKPLR